ncbi:uncharacterized protein LOC127864550 isoform X5 [Dreissena polymorpha]|nr:uncharacterized protein LOC127864550 isoform X3 [Dreissena polymorpha]XP_052260244.1 uncharacterized protein LOC127864550 isoform X5 [Dreissena polymorpha]
MSNTDMRITRTQKSPILAVSKKYKRRKGEVECKTMESDTASESEIIKTFYSTTQTSGNSLSARVSVETLNSHQTLDNSVCVKVETDEWYTTAAGFYSASAKLKQIQGDKIHPDCNKQDGFNLIHAQTGCLQMDQDHTKQDGSTFECLKSEQTKCEVLHQDVTRQAYVNSVCANKNTNANSNAFTAQDELHSVCGETKQFLNLNTDQSHLTTHDPNSVCGKPKQNKNTETDNGNRTSNDHNSLCGKRSRTSRFKTPNILRVKTAPSSRLGSVSLLKNLMTVNSAEQHLPIPSNSSLHAKASARTSNVKTVPSYHLSPSDVLKEADDRLLLRSWYALPSNNHSVHAIEGSIIDAKPVISNLDSYTLHGNVQHGSILSTSSGFVPSVVSPLVPPVDSQPTDSAKEGNIPLPSCTPQSSQPQYNQQQQPQLVTRVKAPQIRAIAEPVFDEKQDTDDKNHKENKHLVSNELQLSQICSQEVLLDSENGKLMQTYVPHSVSDVTPVIHCASKTVAIFVCTLPVQVLPTSISIPSVVSSSVTAGSRKSSDALGERACKSVKKDVPTNQSIGLSSDVMESIYQNVAKLPVNAVDVPMFLISCDSKSNQSQDISDSQSNGMPLFVSSNMAEFAVTSEINSNLAAKSVESSDDYIERNKRKSKSCQATHPSLKRIRCQGSSRGVVQPRSHSARENAVTRTVPLFMKSSKIKLDRTGVRVKKVKRMKKANTPEKDKTEYSLQERNLASCMNLEPPDNDHFLYCGECNKEFEGDCPVHGPYNYIQDKEVQEGDPLKAYHTLPECLEIKSSKKVRAGLGVFSKVGLASRIMFGPYRGDIITDNPKSGYCWQIYKEGKASHFVDAQNKATSNWMRYVNCAMKEADQNLVAFQYKGGIYYCTLKPISPEEELLVWYGDEFARELGLNRDDKCKVCGFLCKHSGNLKTHMRIHTGERPYKCEVCGYSCRTKWNLKAHIRIHTGERPYKCEVCGYACIESGTLKTHMRIHSGERPYRCDVCGYECNQSGSLKIHMRIHSGERLYKCDVCDHACSGSDALKRHMRKHTGERLYKCEVCGYECNQSSSLKIHMRIHSGERPYKCEVCGYAFYNSGTLKTHMRIHSGERPYRCEVCGYECNQSGSLKIHMRIHSGERPYKCEMCDYACNISGTLKTHMRIHTEERPYTCDVCGYSCRTSSNLKAHMRRHTGERPYKCEVCDEAFKLSGDLKAHMRIHTEKKTHKCDFCGYACNESCNLKKHMRIHTGERPYKCEVCDYACIHNSYLKTHMRIHTGERPYKCEVCGYACNHRASLKAHMRIHAEERVVLN